MDIAFGKDRRKLGLETARTQMLHQFAKPCSHRFARLTPIACANEAEKRLDQRLARRLTMERRMRRDHRRSIVGIGANDCIGHESGFSHAFRKNGR